MLRATAAFAAIFLMAGLQSAQAADTRSSADTFVDGSNATTRTQNFGTQRTIRLRNSGIRQAFVRFANPSGSVPKAELFLRADTVNVAGSVEIRRITSPWSETSVTYNTKPTMASAAIASRTITTADAGKVVSFDITPLVQSWASAPGSNFGLAVVASPGSPAQVYFSARESGASVAPLLRIQDGPPPSDNEVTVGRSGADYPDPVSASRNAYAGDTWCQSPTQSAPCTITIQPGIYILQETFEVPALVNVAGSGSDMNSARLIARRGLEVAVRVTADSSVELSNFTVFNTQADTNRTIAIEAAPGTFGVTLMRMGAHASGGSLPAAISMGNAEQLEVLECDVSARGGTRAVGIGPGAREVVIAQSKVSVTGAANEAVGIDVPDGNFRSLDYFNNEVVVRGDGHGTGVIAPEDDEVALTVNGGFIYTGTNGDALGIQAGGGAGTMTGMRIIARGGENNFSIGARVTSEGTPRPAEIVVDETIIEASNIALELRGQTGFAVRRSQITSELIGLRLLASEDPEPVLSVEHSTIEGSAAFREEDPFPTGSLTAFSDSLLAGALQFQEGNRYSCTNVFDREGRRLNAECQ